MVILHISDLHFGKTLSSKSLAEDQREWANRFLALVRRERPAAVVIAGDVYDRAAPSGDAVEMLDRFLTELLAVDENLAVMLVAGNHDSGQRLSFGSEILKKHRLFIAGRTEREMTRVDLADENGPVSFWLMPYTFPAAIAHTLGLDEDAPRSYTEAVKAYVGAQDLDPGRRNVLVAHQSVTSDGKEAEQGGSETMVGGVGGVDVAAFDAFDYVALGHIHKAQAIGRDTVRYAGSPLCYHFDEARWPQKGALRVELGAKGTVDVKFLEIPPLHPLRVVKGPYDDIVATEAAGASAGEYVKVIVTDRRLSPEISDSLHALFLRKGDIALEVQSSYSDFSGGIASGAAGRERSLGEKFTDFWKDRHGGTDPDEKTHALVKLAAAQVEADSGDDEKEIQALIDLATKED